MEYTRIVVDQVKRFNVRRTQGEEVAGLEGDLYRLRNLRTSKKSIQTRGCQCCGATELLGSSLVRSINRRRRDVDCQSLQAGGGCDMDRVVALERAN